MSYVRFFAILPLLWMAGCGSKTEKAETTKQPPVVRVTGVAVTKSQVQTERVIPGTITARSTVSVSARLPGHLREVRVREGDRVTAGQVIAIVDARDAEAAIRQAEAGRDEARAALPEAQAAIASVTAQAELARATFRRMEQLHNSKSITGQEFDEAKARRQLAESQVQMAQARLHQTQERIRQAGEALGRAQLQETYGTVTAPFAGVVLERRAEPGTFVNPGMPVVLLEKSGEFRLEVPVEESLLKDLKPGRTVTVELDARMDLPVSEILPSVDPQSRTATVRVNLPPAGAWRTGMSGRLVVRGEPREALSIPATALRTNGQLQTVFVVENGRAKAALVTAGEVRDGRVEIVSGLNGGERVVAAPTAALSDGSPVEVAQ